MDKYNYLWIPNFFFYYETCLVNCPKCHCDPIYSSPKLERGRLPLWHLNKYISSNLDTEAIFIVNYLITDSENGAMFSPLLTNLRTKKMKNFPYIVFRKPLFFWYWWKIYKILLLTIFGKFKVCLKKLVKRWQKTPFLPQKLRFQNLFWMNPTTTCFFCPDPREFQRIWELCYYPLFKFCTFPYVFHSLGKLEMIRSC